MKRQVQQQQIKTSSKSALNHPQWRRWKRWNQGKKFI